MYSVASTLPLWNDKKNVTITYSPLAGHPATTFDDLVQYNKRSDPVGKHASSVKGVDKLEEGTGSRWKWSVRATKLFTELYSMFLTVPADCSHRRGKGWLMIASSHWQLLGYRLLPPSSVAASAAAPPDDPEWVVTYFSATMFTPAGLDIYSRTKTMSDAFVDRLVGEIKNLGGEVAECCNKGDGMFRIPHD